MHLPKPVTVLLASLMLGIAGSGQAYAIATGTADTLPIVRATGPIRLDGRVDEAAWQSIPPIRLTMYTPTEGREPSEASEVRLTYDGQYLYAAGRFLVSDVHSIMEGLVTRDQLGPEDHFMLILDSSNDNQTGLLFAINPSGGQTDYSIGQDGASLDDSWNGYWDGATTRDTQGWYAEIRIPLSTLRFESIAGMTTMGLIIHRKVAARSEFDTYPLLPRSFSSALFRPSIAQKIRFDGLEARSPLYLTPYALWGINSAAALNQAGTAFGRRNDGTQEVGFDLKLGLSSSVTVDLTANTDFAQVEADNQEVNLTRFSLFFPEKRQFFLERSDIFEVAAGNGSDPDRLFHSRRIGLAGDGTPLRIYGGARTVGRVGSWDFGFLTMQTETMAGAGSENDAALRLRRQLFTTGSYVGALLTSRLQPDGEYNVVVGGDAVVHPFGNDFVTVQWARSFEDQRTVAGPDPELVRIQWERRGSRGFHYEAGAKWSGDGFDPGLGFQARNDFSSLQAGVGYGWYAGEKTRLTSVTPSLLAERFRRNVDGSDESRTAEAAVNVALKSGWSGTIGLAHTFESLQQPLQFSSVAGVPAGDYDFNQLSLFLNPGSASRLTASLNATVGDFYDGRQFSVGVQPNWTISSHLELSGALQITRLRFPDRHEQFDADIARLRAHYAYNSKLSAAAFVQYNRAANALGANVRVRWHFAEGRDLWVVYNDRLNTVRSAPLAGAPELPVSQVRSLLVKYSHTFAR